MAILPLGCGPGGVVTASAEQRKRAELLAELDSVTGELDLWLAESSEGRPVEKHYTQIRRVAGQLRPIADHVRRSVEEPALGSRWLALEEQVLDLHRVWGFFREKLALRRLEELAPYLTLADEFGWACYEPAQHAFVKAEPNRMNTVREPPLVYLSAAASPFSMVPRRASRTPTSSAPTASPRERRACSWRACRSPVIGVPWFQLRHLPDALVIGHEVGHVVLNEMTGLEAVEALVDAALPGRHQR